MTEPIWFTVDEILETAKDFVGWQYRFQRKDGAGQEAAPQSTFPLCFLDRFAAGIFSGANVQRYRQLAQGDPRATNCVMFGEGLILGTAARTNKPGAAWPLWSHQCAMMSNGQGPRGVIQAYVDAGLGDAVHDGHDEEPTSWCIVQGHHHLWIVAQYDPSSKACLTLEANVFNAPMPREVGYVGHTWHKGDNQAADGWGKRLGPEFLRTGTLPEYQQHGASWTDTRRKNPDDLWFTRLHIRQPTRVFSPLSLDERTSAVFSGYSNNENAKNGHGGYYVYGLQRNLHGGIHLFPPGRTAPGTRGATPPTRVVAMGSGYVVAARLPGPDAAARSPEVIDLLQNWPGFVLVRHEITLRPLKPTTTDEPERHAFYSLYMHLQSPRYLAGPPITLAEDDPYLRPPPGATPAVAAAGPVPWLRRLYRARHGAWVRVRTHQHDEKQGTGVLGERYWSKEEVPPGTSPDACQVYDGPSASALTVRDTHGPIFVHTPAPAKYVEALKDLMDGHVVTFGEPLLPVQGGDGIGYLSSIGVPPRQRGSHVEPSDGFLHFQVFAPERAASAITTMMKATTDLVSGFRFSPCESTTTSFLELAAFKTAVEKHILDAEDKKGLAKIFQDFEDKKDVADLDPMLLVEMLDGKVSFAPAKFDVDWKLDGHCYPVRLDLEVPYLPPVAKHTKAASAGGYRLGLVFKNERGVPLTGLTCRGGVPAPASLPLTIDQAKLDGAVAVPPGPKRLSLVIQVPADAEFVEVTDAIGDLALGGGSEDDQSEEDLFRRTVAGHRWRDVVLTHPNEWSVNEMDRALADVNALRTRRGEAPIEEECARQIAWCDAAKEAPVPRVFLADEEPGPKRPWLTGPLAPTERLVCLHPMTAVWMLAMLGRNEPPPSAPQQKVALEKSFDSTPFRDDRPFAMWGWVGDEHVKPDAVSPGDRLSILLIGDDFGYDAKKQQVELAFTCGKKTLHMPIVCDPGLGGVAKAEIVVDFWLDCALDEANGAKPPKTIDPGGDCAKVAFEPPLRVVPFTDDELGRGFGATRRRGDKSCFAIEFAPSAPRRLDGYAWVEWRLEAAAGTGGAWTPGPICEFAHATSFAEARQEAKTAGKKKVEVATADFELDSRQRTILAPKDRRRPKNVTASAPWRDYERAYTDVNVACSFANALQELAEALRPADVTMSIANGTLEAGGKKCIVLVRTRRKKRGKAAAPSAVETCVEEAAKIGLGAGAKAGGVELSWDGALAVRDGCDKLQNTGLALSDDAKFIRAGATWDAKDAPVSDDFRLAHYRRAFDKSKIRLDVGLAEGLELLRRDTRARLELAYLSLDGTTSHVAVRTKEVRPTMEAAGGYFLGVELLPGGRFLRLTAAPESSAFVAIDATLMLQEIAADAPDDASLEYRLCFHPMVLFHREQVATISRAAYEALCKETVVFDAPYECPSPAGVFSRAAFVAPKEKEEGFRVQCTRRGCNLVLDVALHGTLEAWADFQIVVTRNGKAETQKRIVDRTLRLSVDCGKLADTSVKLEAVLRPDSAQPENHPLPKPYEASYTYHVELGALDIAKVGGEYVFTAKGHSLASPVVVAATGHQQGVEREELAQGLRLEFAPNIAQGGTSPLDELVHYAYEARKPRGKRPWTKHGYCDPLGHFEARLDAAAVDPDDLPTVKLVALPGSPKGLGLLPPGTERPGTWPGG